MNKYIVCPKCGREIEVRWGIMANETLSRHMKEHK
jgi:predicted nucleic-acid-binding Zn-ribbon protein